MMKLPIRWSSIIAVVLGSCVFFVLGFIRGLHSRTDPFLRVFEKDRPIEIESRDSAFYITVNARRLVSDAYAIALSDQTGIPTKDFSTGDDLITIRRFTDKKNLIDEEHISKGLSYGIEHDPEKRGYLILATFEGGAYTNVQYIEIEIRGANGKLPLSNRKLFITSSPYTDGRP